MAKPSAMQITFFFFVPLNWPRVSSLAFKIIQFFSVLRIPFKWPLTIKLFQSVKISRTHFSSTNLRTATNQCWDACGGQLGTLFYPLPSLPFRIYCQFKFEKLFWKTSVTGDLL